MPPTPSISKNPASEACSNAQSDSTVTEVSRRRGGTTGLPWTGILQPDEVDKLLSEFSDLIVCPGYVNRFGGHADEWGKVYLPGAGVSLNDTRKTLRGWKQKGSTDERWSWWPATMASKGIVPITVADVVHGLPMTRWKEYRVLYNRINKSRMTKRKHDQLKTLARSRSQAAAEQEAASVLTNLQPMDAPQVQTLPTSVPAMHTRCVDPKRPRSRNTSRRTP